MPKPTYPAYTVIVDVWHQGKESAHHEHKFTSGEQADTYMARLARSIENGLAKTITRYSARGSF